MGHGDPAGFQAAKLSLPVTGKIGALVAVHRRRGDAALT